jgi:hypothetical protein
MSTRNKWILGVILAYTAGLGAFLLWIFTATENAADESATRFAAALVDPTVRQPERAEDLVRGVRRHFGDVTAARVIDTRSEQYRTRHGSRSHYVSDLLVQTPKGPAVVEAVFGGMGVIDRDVTGVRELHPRDVPDDALSDAEFVALAKAFERRGGRPAESYAIARAAVGTPDARKAFQAMQRHACEARAAVTPTPQERTARRMMRCVKRAKGDVAKLTACAS